MRVRAHIYSSLLVCVEKGVYSSSVGQNNTERPHRERGDAKSSQRYQNMQHRLMVNIYSLMRKPFVVLKAFAHTKSQIVV